MKFLSDYRLPLQGSGEKGEELRWIIAGWTAGKLIESAEEEIVLLLIHPK